MANFSWNRNKSTKGFKEYQQDLYTSSLKLNEEDFRLHQNMQDRCKSSMNMNSESPNHRARASPKHDESEFGLHQNLRDQYESTINTNLEKIASNHDEPDKVLKRNTILVTKEVPLVPPGGGGRRRMSPTMRKQYVTYFQENVYKRENKKENGLVGCYYGVTCHMDTCLCGQPCMDLHRLSNIEVLNCDKCRYMLVMCGGISVCC